MKDLTGDDVATADRGAPLHLPDAALVAASSTLALDRPVRRVVVTPTPSDVETSYERTWKPVIDKVLAVLLLAASLPLLLLVAFVLRISLGPNVLFRQTRVGRDGTTFEVIKFRTMRHDRRLTEDQWKGPERRQTHKTVNDPRHTRIGRLVRKLSLDEFPQLLNVLRGEMSIVGPRPELPAIVADYEPWHHERHRVRPGLTGPWQIWFRDANGEMHLHVRTDVEYAQSVSLATDLRLLLLTVPAMFRFSRAG